MDGLLPVLGERLAGELLAANLGAADPDGAELALADLGAELVLALEPLLPPHPGGGLDAPQLPLQPPAGALRRGPAARGGRRLDHAPASAPAGGVIGGGILLLLLRARLAAGALAGDGGGLVGGSDEGARGARALALPRQRRLHGLPPPPPPGDQAACLRRLRVMGMRIGRGGEGWWRWIGAGEGGGSREEREERKPKRWGAERR